jgi:hypothetical protein
MQSDPCVVANPWKESVGTCDCCGRTSKTIWGDLSFADATVAMYYVQWTLGAPDHLPNVDIVMGPWGEGTDASGRVLASLHYRPSRDGGSFMVIDAQDRLARKQSICGRAMARAEIIGQPIAAEIFALVDRIWLMDPRIAEVVGLNAVA